MSAMIGYVAPHEQFPVPLLLETAVLAEQAGFDAMWASDHFHPWQDNQGHSGHAWLTLAALTQRTCTLLMGTGVTCLSFRNNPAIVAQAFATLSILAPGRVFLGAGTGEAVNEVPPGGGWGPYAERAERMVEAITIIRALWEGEWVSFEGKYHRVAEARVFDKPALPVPIYVAASGPKSARLAGTHGDGLIFAGTGDERARLVTAAFEESARAAGKDPARMPRLTEFFAVLGEEEEATRAARLWQFNGAIASLVDEADPRVIRRLAEERTTPQEAMRHWVISRDPAMHADALTRLIDQGFTHIFVHSPQEDQARFVEMYGREVLPLARQAAARAASSR